MPRPIKNSPNILSKQIIVKMNPMTGIPEKTIDTIIIAMSPIITIKIVVPVLCS